MADVRDSTTKVLDTTELLECILIHLDNRTLLLSQRVNSTFQATITTSIHLQRKLFLRPESTSAGSTSSPKTPNKRFNPLFLDEFGRSLPRIKAVDRSRSGKKHTFFVNRKRKLILESTTSRPAKAADMKGSWRKMLLTQPPTPVRFERHHVTKSGIMLEKKRSNRKTELKYQSCSVAELIGSACPEEMEDV
ncbi:hypothetical protein LTR17_017459 [Elasticomyces elasticus]|nr:hypothetical protein LTR17_017459 [Elasticomyces elasticus]